MTQEEKLEEAKRLYETANADQRYVLESLFPELKESEDERMVKFIKKQLFNIKKTITENYELDAKLTKAIDWLEKQAEHANFRNKIQIGDKVTRNEDGVLVNLSQLKRVAKKDKKQGEQNLIKHFCDCVHVGCHVNDCKRWCHSYQKEISYTDCNSNCNRYSKLMNHAFNIGETITDGISTFKIADIKDNYYIADDGERVEIYMAHRYYTTIQNLEAQKPAWSEEDELHIRELESLVKQVWATAEHGNDKDTIHKMSDLSFFLKTLKPQLKQEWSEEDEYCRHQLIVFCENCMVQDDGAKRCAHWLKSLKQRYTLKASDEHYELEEFAKIVRGNLTGISKAVQKLFEAKYLQLTGNKMYGGYKD